MYSTPRTQTGLYRVLMWNAVVVITILGNYNSVCDSNKQQSKRKLNAAV